MSDQEQEQEQKQKQEHQQHPFKLPIQYLQNVKTVSNSIFSDLELIKNNPLAVIDSNDGSNTAPCNEQQQKQESIQVFPLYNCVYNVDPSDELSKEILPAMATYYTTDTSFLRDTQSILQTNQKMQLHQKEQPEYYQSKAVNKFAKEWKEFVVEDNFCEKYFYIDWEYGKFMNKSPVLLQFMNMYNIIAPIISLLLPIIMLLVPFFFLKSSGVDISFRTYFDILCKLFSNHSFIQLFTDFHKVDMGQKLYLLLSVAFYFYSIYQNVLTCRRLYCNKCHVHEFFERMLTYLRGTSSRMQLCYEHYSKYTSYKPFCDELQIRLRKVTEYEEKLCRISPMLSIKAAAELGNVMHLFYWLRHDEEVNELIQYTFGFHGYLNNIESLIESRISTGDMNIATFAEDGSNSSPKIKGVYYPTLLSNVNAIVDTLMKVGKVEFQGVHDIVKNDVRLDKWKNLVISGPNASGKTTMLKATLANLLLSQQVGFGCYDSCEFTPYDEFYCYLNIPDTSSRDSLFQAEARRCKAIVDEIKRGTELGTTARYFCIFDELYSGTNPEEAVISAYAFMQHLLRHENVTSMLTTHYVKLCKKLRENKKRVKNMQMKCVLDDKGKMEYTYKMIPGISKMKGGVQVLHAMNYPKEILCQMNGSLSCKLSRCRTHA